MFEDGLRYQDARMASEDEMKRDLYGFHINDSRRIPKGGPILFRESDISWDAALIWLFCMRPVWKQPV